MTTPKYGTDWSPDEIAVVVAEYFLMLADEHNGRPYRKSEHRRRVAGAIGRTEKAVEYKFENVSAVLEELSMPWIWGYKPARNYQNALAEAVERHLTRSPEIFDTEFVPTPAATDDEQIMVAPPPPAGRPHHPAMRRLIGMFDPAERDQRNRRLGQAGEEFVLEFERGRLRRAGREDLASNVRWVSRDDGDGYGYDIRSFAPEGAERLLEVKTTYGNERTPFWLTRREWEVAEERKKVFRIRRVFHFGDKPRMFEVPPPLAERLSLTPSCYMALPR